MKSPGRPGTLGRHEFGFHSPVPGSHKFGSSKEQPPAEVNPPGRTIPKARLQSRLDRRVLFAGLVAIALYYGWRQPLNTGLTADMAVYLAGAKSLAEDGSYQFAFHENTPPITLYPPLQSVYLSLFWRLSPQFPENLAWLNCGMFLLGLAFSAMLFLYLRRAGLPRGWTILIVMVWALSPAWYGLLCGMLSDVAFACLWLGLAILWQHRPWEGKVVLGLLTVLLAAAMVLMRTAAVAPLTGLFAALLLGRPRMPPKTLILWAAPVVATILLWRSHASGSVNYPQVFASRLAQEGGLTGYAEGVLTNACHYIFGEGFLIAMFPGVLDLQTISWKFGSVLPTILVGMTMAVCGLAWFLAGRGWYQSRFATDRLVGWGVAAYLVQLLLWPYWLGPRVLYAILPFLIAWIWQGWRSLPSSPAVRRVAGALAAVFLAVNLAGNIWLLAKEKEIIDQSGHLEELRELATWMKTHLPQDSRVAIAWTLPIAHFSSYFGRPLLEDQFSKAFDVVCLTPEDQGHVRPDYLVTSNRPLYLEQLMKSTADFPDMFQLVKTTQLGRYRCYRIDPVLRERYLESAASQGQSTTRPSPAPAGPNPQSAPVSGS